MEPARLWRLRRVATIEGIAPSTWIEGGSPTNAEVEALLGRIEVGFGYVKSCSESGVADRRAVA